MVPIKEEINMKKAYKKPEIVFENFSLSTSIAAGCENPTNLPSKNQCGLDFSGLMVFMNGMTGCEDIQIAEGDDFDGICYHVPTEQNNLFTS